MTCVVGIEHETGVYIGGDSAGIAGWQLTVRADPKVFQVGEFLYGIAGSFRMGNLLRYAFAPPPPPKKRKHLHAYMATDFVDALRAVVEAGGYREKKNEVESLHNASVLIAVRGRLFDLDNDFQIGMPASGYTAIGCGSEVALGSLYTTQDPEHTTDGLVTYEPEIRVHRALGAAEEHNIGVRGPFVIKFLPTTPKAPAPAASSRKRAR